MSRIWKSLSSPITSKSALEHLSLVLPALLWIVLAAAELATFHTQLGESLQRWKSRRI
jgi:hypothetical protein